MIQKVLRFLKTYWLCFLLCGIIVSGFYFSFEYRDLYQTGSEDAWLRFDLFDLFWIFGVPIGSFLYGCMTYAGTKKVWIPLLIVCFVTFSSIIFAFSWKIALFFVAISSVFSLIGTGLAAFVVRFCQAWKEAWKDDPKVEPIDETD